MRFVIEAKVSDDTRARGIRSADFGASVGMSVGLIEIGGLRYIRRNDAVSFTELRDAVDLESKKHRNAV